MLILKRKLSGRVVYKGAVAFTVAGTIAVQEVLHHDGKPHPLHDVEILDPPIGREAIYALTSASAMRPGDPIYTVIKRVR